MLVDLLALLSAGVLVAAVWIPWRDIVETERRMRAREQAQPGSTRRASLGASASLGGRV